MFVTLTFGANPAEAQGDAHEVRGIFWIEGTGGYSQIQPSKYTSKVVARFGGAATTFDLPGIKRTGPQYGIAAGLRIGPLMLGARFRQSDFDDFKFQQLGLNFDFLIRAVPYVHPYFRLGFDYARFTTLPREYREQITAMGATPSDFNSDGGAVTLGGGIRIPAGRYVSIALGCDATALGMKVSGTATAGGSSSEYTSGTVGLQITGHGALTIHL